MEISRVSYVHFKLVCGRSLDLLVDLFIFKILICWCSGKFVKYQQVYWECLPCYPEWWPLSPSWIALSVIPIDCRYLEFYSLMTPTIWQARKLSYLYKPSYKYCLYLLNWLELWLNKWLFLNVFKYRIKSILTRKKTDMPHISFTQCKYLWLYEGNTMHISIVSIFENTWKRGWGNAIQVYRTKG